MREIKDLFKQIPENEWKRKYQEFAAKYDKEELKHAWAQSIELSSQVLVRIAENEASKKIRRQNNTNQDLEY